MVTNCKIKAQVFQLGRKEWDKFSTTSAIRKGKKRDQRMQKERPVAEERFNQIYEHVNNNIKTSVQRHAKSPVWEQCYQCLSLRPGADIFTVEVS